VNYGWRMALLVTGVFYAAMVLAGYVVELLFCRDRHHPLIPEARNAKVIEAGISWNYTIWLNLALLAITTIPLVRSGRLPMLKMLGGSPDADHGHNDDHMDHQHHCHEPH
jgi:hypothetical protein